MKAVMHAAMSALAIVEAVESKHAARRALNGLSAVLASFHIREYGMRRAVPRTLRRVPPEI